MNDKLKKLTKNEFFIKYKTAIIPIFSILISLLLIFLITVPQTIKYLEDLKKLSELKNQTDFFQNKAKTLSSISKSLYQTNLETTLIALPPDQDIPGTMFYISNILSKNGLTLQSMTFSNKPNISSNVSDYQIRIEVIGELTKIKNLVTDLKNSPRILKLNRIELISGSNAAEIHADMDLTTFFQPLPKTIGAVDQPVTALSDQEEQDLQKLNTYKDQGLVLPNTPEGSGGSKPDPFH